MAIPTPQHGVDYPLVLGDSLLHGGSQFLTLSYNFKPASASQAAHGRLDVQPNSQAQLQMGDSMVFQGKYEAATREGLDCVAVFDGTCFRLERLSAAVQGLRHMPGVRGGQRAPTPPPAAPRGITPEPAAAPRQQAAPQHVAQAKRLAPAGLREAPEQQRAKKKAKQQAHVQAQAAAVAGSARSSSKATAPSAQQHHRQQVLHSEPSAASLEDELLRELEGELMDGFGEEQPAAQQRPPPKQEAAQQAAQQRSPPAAAPEPVSPPGAQQLPAPEPQQRQQQPAQLPPSQPQQQVIYMAEEGTEATDLDLEFFGSV